ncbi:MAG: DUF1311 domain-containing protein [Sebaldella sp.]|nr:DUF1311 domain-containing protein [Sebaldella sp.]
MKKGILLLAFLLTFTVFANYENDLMTRMKPIDQKSDQMLEVSVSTKDMTEAVAYSSKEWDKELNVVYKLLMSKLSQENQTALRNKQREWIKTRDKKIADSMKANGSIATLNGSMTFRTETKNRTIELSKAYDKLIGKK